jgi:hypothetical protein
MVLYKKKICIAVSYSTFPMNQRAKEALRKKTTRRK